MRFTDTIQNRENVTEYTYTTYNTTTENGTIITMTNRTVTGWHYEPGPNTYFFDVGGYWTNYAYYSDGSVKDVEITVQLDPNNLTKLLVASKDPWKSYNKTDYFNTHWYYNGANITASQLTELENELANLPVYGNGDLMKTLNVGTKPTNVTVKIKLRNELGEIGTVTIGRHSSVFTVSSQTDWESAGQFFNTTSNSGTLQLSSHEVYHFGFTSTAYDISYGVADSSGTATALVNYDSTSNVNIKTAGGCDYDGDGDADIVHRDSGNEVDLVDEAGNLIDNVVADEYGVGFCGDFDGDGDSDIGTQGQNGLYYQDSVGNSVTLGGTDSTGGVGNELGDLDGDGDMDWAYPTGGNALRYIDAAGNDVAISGATPAGGNHNGVGGTGDVDGDGDNDVVYREASTEYLKYADASGNIGTLVGSAISSPGGVADVDGDGDMDVLYSDSSGNINLVDGAGNTISTGLTAGTDLKSVGALYGSGQSEFSSSGNWTGNTKTLGSGAEQIANVSVDAASLPAGSSLNLLVDGLDSSDVTQESEVITIDQTGVNNYSTSISGYENWRFSFNMTSGSTPEVNSFTVYASDISPPDITIHQPTNTTYSKGTLDLNVTASEAVDVWQYSVDGGTNQTFTPNATLSSLSEGQHHLQVFANDTSGNTGSSDQYFTVDTTPPTTTDNWSVSGWQHQAAAAVELTCTDTTSGCTQLSYRLDTGAWTTVADDNATVTISGSGNHTLEYNATDTAGNAEALQTEYVAIDQLPVGKNATVKWLQIGGSVTETIIFGFDDPDGNEVREVSSPPSGSLSTTNHTATVTGWINPFDWLATVTDFFGQTSSPRQVNVTTTVIDVFSENATGTVNESSQTLITDVTLDIRGAAMNYSVTAATPPVLQQTLRNEDQDPATTTGVTGTQNFTWHWTVDHITTTVFSEYADASYSHTLGTQGVAKNKQLYNNESTDFTRLNVSAPSISGACSNCGYRQIAVTGNTRVNETYNATSDFLTGETEGSYTTGQNGSRASTVSTQYFFNQTNLSVTNSKGFAFTTVDLSSWCSVTTAATVASGTTEVTQRCNNNTFSGDFVTEKNFDFTPQPAEVTLGVNYLGDRRLELANSKGFGWSNLNTTTGVTAPAGCLQTNTTKVELGASQTRNYTVEFSCDPGAIGSPTETVVQYNSTHNRSWYNASDMTITTNETENTRIILKYAKARLTGWDDRLSAFDNASVNDNPTNISITEDSSYVYLTVGTQHGNSSLHKGTYSTSLTHVYPTSAVSGSSGGSDGGGGGGDQLQPAATVEFVTLDRYPTPFITTMIHEFTITNNASRENTVDVTRRDDAFCEFVTVQRSPSSTEFAGAGTYRVPATGNVSVQVRVEMPTADVFDEFAVDGVAKCRFETTAARGSTGPLVVTVEPGLTLLERVNRWFEQRGLPVPLAPYTQCLDVQHNLDLAAGETASCPADEQLALAWAPTFPLGWGLLSGLLLGVVLVVQGVGSHLRQ